MSTASVKTCPYCGGEPYIEACHRAFIHGETTKVAFVRCRDCNARTARVPIELYGRTKAVERAIMLWNATMPMREYVVVNTHL